MKKNLAVIFGGKSVEHEVSIVTGLQIIQNADPEKYNVVPIYIDKAGRWHTGSALLDINNFKNLSQLQKRIKESYINPGTDSQLVPTSAFGQLSGKIKIDVIFPAIHGTFGEDGTLQGLLEMSNIPYVCSGVTGSAVGMDKILQKDILKSNNLPVVPYTWFLRQDWLSDRAPIIKQIEKNLDYPVIVKPANLGSSVGIHKVNNKQELVSAIELGVTFDRRVIVEKCLTNIFEINCSVMGYQKFEVSVCEQPVASGAVLSYEDKYMRGSKTDAKKQGMASLSRIIPAPISDKLTKDIQNTAKRVFQLLDAAGLARVDFLVDKKSQKFYVCEINTLPGSVSFYLWEKTGCPFPKLIDRLVELAFERFEDRKMTNFSFSSNLLEKMGQGSKGSKS